MQGFPSVSLGKSLFLLEIRAKLALISARRACGVFRVSTLGRVLTETLGKLSSLYDKEHCVGWGWPSDCFHLAHTIGRFCQIARVAKQERNSSCEKKENRTQSAGATSGSAAA